ncbi:thioredoxin family protein [Chitinophaga sp. Hz27]|uniref:thioredoxin family protein n=1 Tax=Chitinophaga sp. Hz27 TaxID=3347169 RepID=UPI0035D8B96B
MQALTNNVTHYFTEEQAEPAFQQAKQKGLPLLVDCWAPNCKGCKKMEESTYQHPEVLSYIAQQFVFVKYNIINRNAQRLPCAPVLWTPTFIVFSNDGSEVRKTIGYLNYQQFKAELEIGRALALIRKAQPGNALSLLEDFIKQPDFIGTIPEALYWAGVAAYFVHQRDADSITPYWERLIQDFPESNWADKADCLHIKI